MRALQLIAGPRARQHLLDHGLRQQDFSVIVGASGGPKWMALFGLDQYLLGEFFKDRSTPLDMIGSSAGAWRFACYAQNDPQAASKRFAHAYQHVCFEKGMKVDQVTALCRTILDAAIPTEQNVQEILNNPIRRLNLIACRAKGLNASKHRPVQAAALLMAATANAIHRNTLGAFFERVLFHSTQGKPPFYAMDDLPTHRVPLSEHNLRDAVMASGSIPLALSAVEDIHGAGPGMYYDGGVTDYHFDIPFSDDSLVLYPHFYSHITPGWFDKMLSWRRGNPHHYDNVLILCPSAEWVASLPFGKIPDRKDFGRMEDAERIRYWGEVMKRSTQLAEEMDRIVRHGDIGRYL